MGAACCHLGNISYRLGQQVPFNKKAKALGDDKDSVEALDNMIEHVGRRGELKLEESTYCLGRKLTYDAAAEKFVGDPEADKLLTRPYRQPFVVPEQV